jgi:hypothetical protein
MINKRILFILLTCFICIVITIVSFFIGKYFLEVYIFGNLFKLSNNEMVKKARFLNWNWVLHLAVIMLFFAKNNIKFRWLIIGFIGFFIADGYLNIDFYFHKYLIFPLFKYVSNNNLFENEYIYYLGNNVISIFSTYLTNWFFNTLSIFYLAFCLMEMLLYKRKRVKDVLVSCAWCGNPVLVSKDLSGKQIICSNCSRARSQGRI